MSKLERLLMNKRIRRRFTATITAALAVLMAFPASAAAAKSSPSSVRTTQQTAQASSDVVQYCHSQHAPWWQTRSYEVHCPARHPYLVNSENGQNFRIATSNHITAPPSQTFYKSHYIMGGVLYGTYKAVRGTYHNWNIHDGSVTITLTCTNNLDKAKFRMNYIPV
ncbi:hypothetical protein ACIQMR_31605 [Streptomyces sp. NPDC091376]|uniref:hypothetical protein n=1 Tax=Streptomyces sp. NPDC091376 TaxID=3365994 RepID=UPI0037F6FAE7